MRKSFLALVLMVAMSSRQAVVANARENTFLRELQAELHRRGDPWVAGSTSVSHLSLEEKQKLCGLPLISRRPRDSERQRLSKRPKNQPLVEMDWRNHLGQNWMTPVRSQLSGHATVFATIGAYESRMKIFWNTPDANPDLSEKYLGLCSPGKSLDSLAEFVVQNGVPTEDWNDSFPAPESLMVKGMDWGETSLDVDSIKHEVMNGPTAVAVDWKEGKNGGIREDFFYYKGGLYEPVIGKWIMASHSVCLCGWNSEGNWLIKNSWGTTWGMGGTNGGYGYIGKTLFVNVWVTPHSSAIEEVTVHDLPSANLKICPNPVTSATTIAFYVPDNSTVCLNIYDVTGRVVNTLLDEQKQSGLCCINFNASGLTGGIYFARLTIRDFSTVTNVLVVKGGVI